MELIQLLKEEFYKQFGAEGGVSAFFAPGRVNLIGEHTDYNGGNVFPCAISYGTYGIVRKRKDNCIRYYSKNFEEKGIISVVLDEITYQEKDDWANYPKGVTHLMKEAGYPIDTGYDMLVYGNIPNGAGLSSSASLEVLTGVILRDLFKLEIDMISIVKISQQAENQFVGVNCGIMDQFAIGMGKADNAILLDCNTLKYEYSPVVLGDYALIIVNTNKRRGLADSKYNERRSQCDTALERLQTVINIKALGELSEEAFETHKDVIKDDILIKRAKHAVYENQRTLKAVEALNKGDILAFGAMLTASHNSLRDDYEVTGVELDTLVELALEQPGTIGARMTGAGFGGCAIALVSKAQVEAFKTEVHARYTEKIGYAPTFYQVEIGNGASKLEEVK